MEQYIDKLSECQLSESRLREERDALLRRHECELEELDGRLAAISVQRTQIIDEFKHFLDTPQLLGQNYVQTQNATTAPTGPPKLLRAESAEAALSNDAVGQQQWGKPFQTLLTVDTFETKSNSLCSTPSPTYHSAAHSPNPQAAEIEQPANSPDISPKVEPESKVSDESKTKSKSGRSFKFVHRLAMSKSTGSVPSAITVASPTTTQIESMLFKVRENVHSLDSSTLSQCIDLLSSRILKDKETRINVLATPDIMPDYKMLSPVPAKEDTKVKELKKREVSRPAPIRQNAQSESVPTSASESQSPKQPSSPKKRIETPEERRRRIERVLLQSPRTSGSTLSRSTTSLNEIDLSSSKGSSLRPSVALSRYGNRKKAKVRRNHSLSPLRFCERNKQLSEERELIEESKQTEKFSEIRRFKSDQQLDSDSASGISADDSGNDAENLETDTNDIGPQPRVEISEDVQDESEEVCHLLAPSKVAKSQDLFTKTLFPVEKTKPLMSKEELAKTRKDATSAFKKKQAQSLSQDSSRGSESPDSAGGSLRVDYLSHLRHNSASPEQRSRERELSALSNTKKFKTFMNYWENKTNEIIDKKRNFEQWHQSNTVVGVASQQPEQVQTSNLNKAQKAASMQSQVDKTHRQSKSRSTTKTEKPKQSVTSQSIEQFSQVKTTNDTTNGTAIVKTPHTASSMNPNQTVRNRMVEKPVEKSSFVVPTATTKQPTQASAVVNPEDKKTNRENFENDHLMQRLRHIQQDIRQRRSKQMDGNQQSAPVQQPQQVRQIQPVLQPQQPNLQIQTLQQSRPNMQSAKSLDLTYYPMKQQAFVQPKSAVVRIVQPNGIEPPPTKNRIRLIRSASQNEPDEIPVVSRQGPRSMTDNNDHRHTVNIGHDLGVAFKPIQLKPSQLVSIDSSAPMRSTYF